MLRKIESSERKSKTEAKRLNIKQRDCFNHVPDLTFNSSSVNVTDKKNMNVTQEDRNQLNKCFLMLHLKLVTVHG